MARIAHLLGLALVGMVLAASMHAADAKHPNEDGKREGDSDFAALMEELKPTLEACKDQAQTLCPLPSRGDDNEGPHDRRLAHPKRRRPSPGRAVLCLSDHEGDLTGECATSWAALSTETKDAAMAVGAEKLAPPAHFKRACRSDVTTKCDTDGEKEDILQCLRDAEADLTTDCAAALDKVVQHLEQGGLEDGPSGATVATMSMNEFESIDAYQQEEEGGRHGDDHRHGPSPLVIAAAGVGVAAGIALIVVAIVVVRRRRAARRVSLPVFQPMDNASVGSGEGLGAGVGAGAGAGIAMGKPVTGVDETPRADAESVVLKV